MAYIPYTYVPAAQSRKKQASYTMPTGGVSLSDKDVKVSDGQCALLKNFDIISDRIKTRELCRKGDFSVTGELHGISNEFFMGNIVFHAGNSLCRICEGEEEIHIISDTFPDKKSLICVFLSKIYIYCNTHVYSLDSNFVLTDELTEAPEVFKPTGVALLNKAERNDVPFNLCAPRVTINLESTNAGSFTLPYGIDTSRPLEFYEDEELIDPEKYTVSQEKVSLSSLSLQGYRKVKIVYYLLRYEEAGFEDILSNSKIGVAFGGNTAGGTRLFFMGNSNKCGYYYKSELLNPLYVAENEYEIIADGCEDITAVKKMYGDLIIFTHRSVFKMSYNISGDKIFFSVKEISNEVGCDCPGSVQLIDNRVVFANSKKGVFIVDSTEETGEQNLKPISGNILKGKDMGLLDNKQSDIQKSCSCDFDRKYMLFVGDRVYVWDYNSTPFRTSYDYNAAQQRLCWYIYDNFGKGTFFESDKGFVSLSQKEGNVDIGFYTKDNTLSSESVFESGNSERFLPFIRKHITGMTIKLARGDGCTLKLSLYGDGEKYYERSFPKKSSDKEKIKFSLPRKALYDFGFKISGTGSYEIESITAEYIEISE